MRLLLIERDAMIGAGIRLGLRQDDFVVDWVQDGAAAEHALLSASYAVVLLDLALPRKECLAILELLYARSNPVPVLVIDACQDLEELAARLRAAARSQTQRAEREPAMFALPFSWR